MSVSRAIPLIAIVLALSSTVRAGSPASAQPDLPFQAAWRHCERYRGQEICSDHTLVQRGKNVCGTWSYWASGTTYEGQEQLTAVRRLTARRDLICGTSGSETSTTCQSSYEPQGGWEKAKHGYLMICDGALDEADQPAIDTCSRYFRRKPLTRKEVKSYLDEPWVQQCLARP